MATAVQGLSQPPRLMAWIGGLLQEELASYRGRTALIARMTLAATLVMIICMTFQIPFAFQGAIYALLISRESPRATLESAGIIAIVTAVGATFLLVSVQFVINIPGLHFFWVIGCFFLAFYAIGTLTNYTMAVIFAIMVSVVIPLWDRHVSAETNVEDTLRLCLVVSIAVVITGAIELAFARPKPGDKVVVPISDRLSAVGGLLTCYAEGRSVDPAVEKQIVRQATVGTSMLRSILRRSGYSPQYSVDMSGVAALVGRLVDLAASLSQLHFQLCAEEQRRFRSLAAAVLTIRDDLTNRRIPAPIQFDANRESAAFVPLLGAMEHTVTLISEVFAGCQSVQEYVPSADDLPRPALLAPDALANSEHLRFALKGCLAAGGCYVFYNLVAWPGISTAVTTCLLTALSTIGSSRQKQVLRIAGAIVGGLVIGMGSQIFVLPYLNSIAGFVVLFAAVTALSAWFMTSSPRLSYFGLQVALAFYLINLSEFKIQTSLAVARDRVVGILFGLSMMWLVFDRLWGVPAAVQMTKTFISNLRLLAQFAREPATTDPKAALARSLALGETVNTNLDKVRALADGVLLEFGPSRQQDLVLRNRIRQWQPNLRMLFITRIVLLKYRLRLPGFELPEALQPAQQEFDSHLAAALDGMADRLEGAETKQPEDLTSAYAQLEQAASKASPDPQHQRTPTLQSLLLLSQRVADLTDSLEQDIG